MPDRPGRMPDVHQYGDRALLVECADTAEVLALTAALTTAALPEVTEIVPGARTVLLGLRATGLQPTVRARLAGIAIAESPAAQEVSGPDFLETVVLDVVYDGPDLDEVAALLGMTVDGVVAAHTGTPWQAGFVGFAPGFAYLIGGDPRLRVPRRAEPRVRVPAGAVALAGEFSAVYPRASPGGWQLIGRTDAVLWDPGRANPALLRPGTTVRFRAVR